MYGFLDPIMQEIIAYQMIEMLARFIDAANSVPFIYEVIDTYQLFVFAPYYLGMGWYGPPNLHDVVLWFDWFFFTLAFWLHELLESWNPDTENAQVYEIVKVFAEMTIID